MSTLTETTSPNGKGAIAGLRQKSAPPSPLRRRRQVPWIVAGVLLVVGCALAFGVTSLRVVRGEQVLAVSRPVAAGQLVQASDLRVVRVSPSSGLEPVLASAEAAMLGRPAAVALVPGTLLTPADVGAPPLATSGFAVVALGLKAGAYPPSVSPGEQVEVVPVVGSAGTSSGSAAPLSGQLNPIEAVVLAVDASPAGSSTDAVVSLQVAASDATEVASLAAAGQAALVVVPLGSGN